MIYQFCFYLLEIFQSPLSLVPFGLIAYFFILEFPYIPSPIRVLTFLDPILATLSIRFPVFLKHFWWLLKITRRANFFFLSYCMFVVFILSSHTFDW